VIDDPNDIIGIIDLNDIKELMVKIPLDN